MPSCVVRSCKNNSGLMNKKHGITFHRFPKLEQSTKQKWIAVIRQSRKELSWNPTSCSVVCSAHFNTDDMYYTSKGLRRVIKTGYPKILLNIIEGLDDDDVSQPLKEDPAAKDLSNHSDLSELSTSCAVEAAATSPDLSVLDLDQRSTSCAVQTVESNPSTTNIKQRSAGAGGPCCSVTTNDTEKLQLRKRLIMLEKKLKNNRKHIRTLNQKVRRLLKKNRSFKEILRNLKKLLKSGLL